MRIRSSLSISYTVVPKFIITGDVREAAREEMYTSSNDLINHLITSEISVMYLKSVITEIAKGKRRHKYMRGSFQRMPGSISTYRP